jgi:hypothetical protein
VKSISLDEIEWGTSDLLPHDIFDLREVFCAAGGIGCQLLPSDLK